MHYLSQNTFIWFRVCPDCGKTLKYNRKSDCEIAYKNKSLCFECAGILRRDISWKSKNSPPYVRQCSKCNRDITYKTWDGFKKAIKNDTVCRSCAHSKKHTRKHNQEQKTEWFRNCPKCKETLYYSNKYDRNYAENKGTICKRCSAPIKISENLKKDFKGQFFPNYNPKGCISINQLNIKNNWQLQHAENGGEHYIEQLGYWVDGFDPINKIIVEYDEEHHFNIEGNLKEKDIQRQKEIQEIFPEWKFIRIKE